MIIFLYQMMFLEIEVFAIFYENVTDEQKGNLFMSLTWKG